jgi:RHS repeat-associated protein
MGMRVKHLIIAMIFSCVITLVRGQDPVISSSSTSTCRGKKITLSITNFSTTFTYQWQKDGASIANATGPTYEATLPGVYRVRAKFGKFQFSSNDIRLTFNLSSAPTFTEGSSLSSVCGDNRIFSTQAGKTNYQWKVTGGAIAAGEATNSITVQWNNTGTKSVSVSYTNEDGCATAEAKLSITVVSNQFCQQYDQFQRLVRKKSADADWVEMVYDDKDRVVLTQDGNQRAKSPREWTFTKYDRYDRVILLGIYKDVKDRDREAMQQSVNDFYHPVSGTPPPLYETYVGKARGNVHFYTNLAFPDVSAENDFLQVVYYDSYTAIEAQNPSVYQYRAVDLAGTVTSGGESYKMPDGASTRVKGLATVGKVKILDLNTWLWNVSYYDDDGHVVQRITDNHLGGIDRISSIVDFEGKPLKVKSTHTTLLGAPVVTTRRLDYDHSGRILQVWHQVNQNREVLLMALVYNELGQVVTKKLHSENNGADFLQVIDYRYNAQGWLTRINHADLTADDPGDPRDVFGMEIGYEQDIGIAGTTPYYNGNISAVRWSVNQGLGIQNAATNMQEATEQAYTLRYDPMNRLLSATHSSKMDTWVVDDQYNEHGFQYDQNGNILNLTRTDALTQKIDIMKYAYTNNTLTMVSDQGNASEGFIDGNSGGIDYAYDRNGNMTMDQNKGFASNKIGYNMLDKLSRVEKSTSDYATFTYDASGTKLQQQIVEGNRTKTIDYSGAFVYEDHSLQFLLHEEGRIIPAGSSWEYQYEIKDYLGNVRVTVSSQRSTMEAGVATMEDEHAAEERSKYLYYDEAVKVNSILFDHTSADKTAMPGKTYYATRLSGTAQERVGLARSLSVMPGDKVTMEVYAKYVDPDPSQWQPVLKTLLTSILNGTAAPGTLVDGGKPGSLGENVFPVTSLLDHDGGSGTAPKAYLNYVIVDRAGTRALDMGYVAITEAAKENGTDSDHEKLYMDITVRAAGYLYTWISNENDTPVDVFFDDFRVSYTASAIVEQRDYYPFGLAYNNARRENVNTIEMLYQGKELEAKTNWYDFHARRFDSQLGRFTSPDPQLTGFSLFAGMNNNPMTTVDADGENPLVVAVIVGAAIAALTYTAEVAFSDQGFENWNWGQFALNVGIGAVSGAATYGVGTAVQGIQSTVGRELVAAAIHANIQGVIASAQGGNYGSAALSGAVSSLVGSSVKLSTVRAPQWVRVSATIGSSAAVGGATAEFSGGSFWKGFAIGATIASANHVAHGLAADIEEARWRRRVERALAQQGLPTSAELDQRFGESFRKYWYDEVWSTFPSVNPSLEDFKRLERALAAVDWGGVLRDAGDPANPDGPKYQLTLVETRIRALTSGTGGEVLTAFEHRQSYHDYQPLGGRIPNFDGNARGIVFNPGFPAALYVPSGDGNYVIRLLLEFNIISNN